MLNSSFYKKCYFISSLGVSLTAFPQDGKSVEVEQNRPQVNLQAPQDTSLTPEQRQLLLGAVCTQLHHLAHEYLNRGEKVTEDRLWKKAVELENNLLRNQNIRSPKKNKTGSKRQSSISLAVTNTTTPKHIHPVK